MEGGRCSEILWLRELPPCLVRENEPKEEAGKGRTDGVRVGGRRAGPGETGGGNGDTEGE